MARRAHQTSRTKLSYWFCLTLLSLFPSLCDSLRYVNAQAIPMQDAYLNADPIHVQFVPSQIKCVALCSTDPMCLSINYFEDKTCQLLKDFLCENKKNLVSKPGAKYFDVDFLRTPQELHYYTAHSNCISLNRCSPKCKDCTLGSTYTNIAVGRINGNNINVAPFKSLTDCEQLCLANPECRAFEHESIFCFLSALTRDMMNPDAFEVSPYHYAERICT
ncbi:hypothetical protein LOTGIDRAFT_159062 [Lottia gigantea]|uniref:Apple domain-containing protein n=1 Tax=Lottia gigantea TaxID=225164 RepID=V4AXG5_LOTGI|nr:hypothetical protein LOTGIDRAFT_159062 [Lottia gigantea]ESO98266.1 hypothetical protein LOTGIDRAFT_159062 [Lottia gigantea]